MSRPLVQHPHPLADRQPDVRTVLMGPSKMRRALVSMGAALRGPKLGDLAGSVSSRAFAAFMQTN